MCNMVFSEHSLRLKFTSKNFSRQKLLWDVKRKLYNCWLKLQRLLLKNMHHCRTILRRKYWRETQP